MPQEAPRVRRRELWMPCPDGVHLATTLWLPPGEGPWPALLMRQPYGRAIASTVTYAHPRWYAAQGFLVVVQDVRGRGDSEGEFGGFAQEAADGAVAVQWCRRLPEGNGRVGTYGFSYQGLTQLLNSGACGRDGPDPLPDCLAPAMCGPDERRHWASEGGAHWWSLGLGWALQLAAEGCRRRADARGWRRIRRSLETGAYLEEGPGLLRELDLGGMGLEWLDRDPGVEAGWRRHPIAETLLRRPLLLIGGWHDPHLTGVLELFERSRQAGGGPRLTIGAWSHLDWNGGIDALQLAFFRHHLHLPPTGPQGHDAPEGAEAEQHQESGFPAAKPPPTPPPASGSPSPAGRLPAAWANPADRTEAAPALPEAGGMSLQCPRHGTWSTEAEEAPEATRGWGLCSDGRAAIRSDEGQLLPPEQGGQGGVITVVHDPWRPVPSRGGHLGPEPGLAPRGDLDRRGDVACFQTARLERELRLVGRPQLQIQACADQPGFDLWAALSVVQSEGTVLQLCTGVSRFVGADALTSATRVVQLQPLATSLAAGERLRLSLAGAGWPAIAVNPGDGRQPRGGGGPGHRIISLDLDLHAARLWLAPLIGAN